VTGSVHLKVLKSVVIPYYLQVASQNTKAARASVYVKAGGVNAEEDERRSMTSALPDTATTAMDNLTDI
jgi:hypothetical protein